MLVKGMLTEVKFTDRKEALRNKTKQTKEFIPFVATYNLATPNLKKILMKHWHIIQQQPKIKQIFNQLPIVSYRKEKSLKYILVRGKIPSISQQTRREFAFDHFDCLPKTAITHPCVYCNRTESTYFQIF